MPSEIRAVPHVARIIVKVTKIETSKILGRSYVELKFGDQAPIKLYVGDSVDLEMHDESHG